MFYNDFRKCLEDKNFKIFEIKNVSKINNKLYNRIKSQKVNVIVLDTYEFT